MASTAVRHALLAFCCLLSGQAAAETLPSLGRPGVLPETSPVLSGRASFYGAAFGGRKTASGDSYEHHIISAASNRFPLGTLVAVRRVPSARCVVVRINDRMGHRSRLVALSREAAVRLGMIDAGVAEVEVVALPKYLIGHEHACLLAFQPPVHLHAQDGRDAVRADK